MALKGVRRSLISTMIHLQLMGCLYLKRSPLLSKPRPITEIQLFLFSRFFFSNALISYKRVYILQEYFIEAVKLNSSVVYSLETIAP